MAFILTYEIHCKLLSMYNLPLFRFDKGVVVAIVNLPLFLKGNKKNRSRLPRQN